MTIGRGNKYLIPIHLFNSSASKERFRVEIISMKHKEKEVEPNSVLIPCHFDRSDVQIALLLIMQCVCRMVTWPKFVTVIANMSSSVQKRQGVALPS